MNDMIKELNLNVRGNKVYFNEDCHFKVMNRTIDEQCNLVKMMLSPRHGLEDDKDMIIQLSRVYYNMMRMYYLEKKYFSVWKW